MGKRSRPTLFRSSSAWKAFRIISCCSLRRVVVVVTKDFCTHQQQFLQYILNLIIKQQLHNRNIAILKNLIQCTFMVTVALKILWFYKYIYMYGNYYFRSTVLYEAFLSHYFWSSVRLTVPSWLTVTSSILALKWGVQGGSTTVCEGRPIVGDGRVKSMLGGGICDWKVTDIKSYFYNCNANCCSDSILVNATCINGWEYIYKQVYFVHSSAQTFNLKNTLP